jgi:hypothetical protein
MRGMFQVKLLMIPDACQTLANLYDSTMEHDRDLVPRLLVGLDVEAWYGDRR